MEGICTSCLYASITPLRIEYKSRRKLVNTIQRTRYLSTRICAVSTVQTPSSEKTETALLVKEISRTSALEQLDIERGVCIPFRKYSPESVRNKVLESRGQIFSLVGRGIEIVWSLGLYWTTLLYDYLVGRDEEVVPFRARQLRKLLCDLGPSFIKAGQVLANRPDIIREDYMNELCILQDDVPAFPNQKRNWASLLKLFSAKFHHKPLQLQVWVKYTELLYVLQGKK
ncbi:hypothetical protein FXO38_06244, partial [Capsicum annuum]